MTDKANTESLQLHPKVMKLATGKLKKSEMGTPLVVLPVQKKTLPEDASQLTKAKSTRTVIGSLLGQGNTYYRVQLLGRNKQTFRPVKELTLRPFIDVETGDIVYISKELLDTTTEYTDSILKMKEEGLNYTQVAEALKES